MQAWGETYKNILIDANLVVDFLRGFVDDGKHISSVLAKGMRFEEKERFNITQEGLAEDDVSTESVNARMARLCLPAMNAINSDLEFTIEISEDFPQCRLPTLDFFLWLVGYKPHILREGHEDRIRGDAEERHGGAPEGLHPSQ